MHLILLIDQMKTFFNEYGFINIQYWKALSINSCIYWESKAKMVSKKDLKKAPLHKIKI